MESKAKVLYYSVQTVFVIYCITDSPGSVGSYKEHYDERISDAKATTPPGEELSGPQLVTEDFTTVVFEFFPGAREVCWREISN